MLLLLRTLPFGGFAGTLPRGRPPPKPVSQFVGKPRERVHLQTSFLDRSRVRMEKLGQGRGSLTLPARRKRRFGAASSATRGTRPQHPTPPVAGKGTETPIQRGGFGRPSRIPLSAAGVALGAARAAGAAGSLRPAHIEGARSSFGVVLDGNNPSAQVKRMRLRSPLPSNTLGAGTNCLAAGSDRARFSGPLS